MRGEEGVELRGFPDDVLSAARETAVAVLDDLADSDAMVARILRSYRQAHRQLGDWASLTLAPMSAVAAL